MENNNPYYQGEFQNIASRAFSDGRIKLNDLFEIAGKYGLPDQEDIERLRESLLNLYKHDIEALKQDSESCALCRKARVWTMCSKTNKRCNKACSQIEYKESALKQFADIEMRINKIKTASWKELCEDLSCKDFFTSHPIGRIWNLNYAYQDLCSQFTYVALTEEGIAALLRLHLPLFIEMQKAQVEEVEWHFTYMQKQLTEKQNTLKMYEDRFAALN